MAWYAASLPVGACCVKKVTSGNLRPMQRFPLTFSVRAALSWRSIRVSGFGLPD
jgi:hypothetical protein